MWQNNHFPWHPDARAIICRIEQQISKALVVHKTLQSLKRDVTYYGLHKVGYPPLMLKNNWQSQSSSAISTLATGTSQTCCKGPGVEVTKHVFLPLCRHAWKKTEKSVSNLEKGCLEAVIGISWWNGLKLPNNMYSLSCWVSKMTVLKTIALFTYIAKIYILEAGFIKNFFRIL